MDHTCHSFVNELYNLISSFYKLQSPQKRMWYKNFGTSCSMLRSFQSLYYVCIDIHWKNKCCNQWLSSQVTYRRMKDALVQLSKGVQKGPAADLIPVLFGESPPTVTKKDVKFTPFNSNLDNSQVCKHILLHFLTLEHNFLVFETVCY